MFRIKMKVIDDLAKYSHLSYKANIKGGFINIPHEKLETEAYLEPDNSRSVFVLKTNLFENNFRYEIDFPLTEDGIEKYVDYIIFKVEKEERTKAFNNLYNILNLVFGGPTLKIHLTKYYNQQFKKIVEKIDNNAKEHANNLKKYIDKMFEESKTKMPENIKNIEFNNDWFGPRTAKAMLSKPIIIPRTKGDSGKFGKTLGNIVWDEFKYEPNHQIDALHYFVKTELEKLKKEKNNMNKKIFLSSDFFPILSKGSFLATGLMSGGNQFKITKLNGQKKLKQPRPDSVMIDEEHHIVVAFLNGKRYIAECQEGDKFDFRVGLGNIVSKCNDSNIELKYLRDVMKWKDYYLYCYNKFFYFNQERIKAFENSVLAEKEQYRLRFNEEKVRKYKCELNREKYKERKVTHNFIKI